VISIFYRILIFWKRNLHTRFVNTTGFSRWKYQQAILKLSLIRAKYEFVGGWIDENNNFALKTPDGYWLSYNYSDPRITQGDGQRLDFRSSFIEDPIRAEILKYLPTGGVHIDVGANNGYYYSLQVERLRSAIVLAIEPDPQILQHLRRNVILNGCASIEIIECALTDRIGIGMLTDGLGASNYLDPEYGAKSIPTSVTTLDEIVFSRNLPSVDTIKVDIEGGEFKFLHGARETFAKFQPKVIMELRPEMLERSGVTLEKTIKLIHELGYQVSNISNHDFLLIPI